MIDQRVVVDTTSCVGRVRRNSTETLPGRCYGLDRRGASFLPPQKRVGWASEMAVPSLCLVLIVWCPESAIPFSVKRSSLSSSECYMSFGAVRSAALRPIGQVMPRSPCRGAGGDPLGRVQSMRPVLRIALKCSIASGCRSADSARNRSESRRSVHRILGLTVLARGDGGGPSMVPTPVISKSEDLVSARRTLSGAMVAAERIPLEMRFLRTEG